MTAEIKNLFEGNWVSYKSENMDALLDKTGAPAPMRAAMKDGDFRNQIEVVGEEIVMTGNMGPRTYSTSCRLDQDFTLDSEYIEKGHTTFSDGVMTTVLTPKDASRPPQTIKRRIVNGEMVMTVQVEDVVSTRYLKRS